MSTNYSEEDILAKLDDDISEWINLREATIKKLREIADYIDSLTKKSTIAKAIGSSSGAIAGGLGVIGGALTLASAGLAAVPFLFIGGTALGLTAAVTGASASITEKIIKSKQLSEARAALAEDSALTSHLQQVLAENGNLVQKVTKDILESSYDMTSNTYKLVAAFLDPDTTPSFLFKGLEVTSNLIGGDVSIEVSKLLVQASGRVISGSLSVVIGGATMVYDIYKVKQEIENLAKSGDTADLRSIADKLEEALKELMIND